MIKAATIASPLISENHLFRNPSIGRAILLLGIPGFVTLLVNASFGIVDNFFLGKSIGADANSALAVSFVIIMMIISFGTWMSYGTAPSVSRYFGENKGNRLTGIVQASIITSFILGILVGVLFRIFLPEILSFFGANEKILPLALEFCKTLLFGTPAAIVSIAGAAILTALGNAKTVMLGSLSGLVMNIFLNLLLVNYLNLEAFGSALATVITQYFLATFWMVILQKKFRFLERESSVSQYLYELSSILSLGFPVLMTNILGSCLIILFNRSGFELGGNTALAVIGIGFQFYRAGLVMMIAIAQAIQPIIGYNLGQKNFLNIKKSLWIGIVSSSILGIIYFLIFYFALPIFINSINENPSFQTLALTELPLVMSGLPLLGIITIGTFYFQFLGDKKTSLYLNSVRLFFIQIPFLLFIPKFFGLKGLWWSLPLSDLFSFIIVLLVLYSSNSVKSSGVKRLCLCDI